MMQYLSGDCLIFHLYPVKDSVKNGRHTVAQRKEISYICPPSILLVVELMPIAQLEITFYQSDRRNDKLYMITLLDTRNDSRIK